MAERLNNIAYQSNSGTGQHQPANFNPRSVSLDIRTPEELAAVNEFLVALGRDVSGSNIRPSFTPETYFDPVSLTQLGLTGMPGIGTANFSENTFANNNNSNYLNNNNNAYSRSTHPSAHTGQYGNVYTDMNESTINYSANSEYHHLAAHRRQSGKFNQNSSPPFSNQHYHHPTPPLENSPLSSVSTPATTTPPQLSLSMPDTFDYLRLSRGTPAVAHLAPPEYMGMLKRPMIPLKALPGTPSTRPQTLEPKLPLLLHQTPASTTSKPGSLYPLLTSGDIQYKLPPLNKMYRSPSPPSRESTSTPSSTHSSPIAQSTVLPGIRSLASVGRPTESDDLTKDIGRIELERIKVISQEERKRHAELILNILISINDEFKNRYELTSSQAKDVEMIVA